MNWMLVAAWVPALITLCAVLLWSGEFKQRVKSLEVAQVDQGTRLTGIDKTLATHAEELAEGRGWRKGFDAAHGKVNDKD